MPSESRVMITTRISWPAAGLVPPSRIVYNRIPLREDENLPAVRNKIEEILDSSQHSPV